MGCYKTLTKFGKMSIIPMITSQLVGDSNMGVNISSFKLPEKKKVNKDPLTTDKSTIKKVAFIEIDKEEEENVYSYRASSSVISNSSNNNIEDFSQRTIEPKTKLLSIQSFAPRDSTTESSEELKENDEDIELKDESENSDSEDSFSSLEPNTTKDIQSPNTVPKFPEPVSFDFGFVSPLPKLNTVANFTEKTVIRYIKHEDDPPFVKDGMGESTGLESNVLQLPQTQTSSPTPSAAANDLCEKNSPVLYLNSFKEENEESPEPEKELETETHGKIINEPEIFNVQSNFVDKRVISYIPRRTNDFNVERTTYCQQRQVSNFCPANSILSATRIFKTDDTHTHNVRNDQSLKKLSEMKRLKREEMKTCNSNLELLSNLISVHPLVRSRSDNKTSVLRTHSNKQRSKYRQEMEAKVLHYNRLHPRDWQ